MGNTPRALNRFFLGTFGVLLLALGLGFIATLTLPQAQQAWETYRPTVQAEIQQALTKATLDTPWGQTSLLTLALLLVLLLALTALLWLIKKQRARRVSNLISQQDSQGKGETVLSHTFVKEALKQAFADSPDLLAVTVTSLAIKKTSGVQVKLTVRQGANLLQLHQQTARIIQGLDRVLGYEIPILVRVTGGLRATLHKEEQRVS
ncbi:hypothetical protein ACFP6B_01270 [Rothia nasimurium]|uniref:hypothetical protein n=1 Tax=Rothia nasimurium TaxID=85336 RepID=UPI00361FDB21